MNSEGKEGEGRKVGKGGGASPFVSLLQLGAELRRKKSFQLQEKEEGEVGWREGGA